MQFILLIVVILGLNGPQCLHGKNNAETPNLPATPKQRGSSIHAWAMAPITSRLGANSCPIRITYAVTGVAGGEWTPGRSRLNRCRDGGNGERPLDPHLDKVWRGPTDAVSAIMLDGAKQHANATARVVGLGLTKHG